MHPNRAPRRRYDSDFKSKILIACNEPGASISAVARAHGLNANLVQKWRRGRGMGAAQTPPKQTQAMQRATEFVALSLPAVAAPVLSTTSPPDIRIEIKRGATTLSISWPSAVASDCGAWLREWLR
jgi:transposase